LEINTANALAGWPISSSDSHPCFALPPELFNSITTFSISHGAILYMLIEEMHHARVFVSSLFILAGTWFTLFQLFDWDMQPPRTLLSLALLSLVASQNTTVDLRWFAPKKTWINDLSTIFEANGTHDFHFNGSTLAPDKKYGTYNWCNMPHVRHEEYPMPREGYNLEYVEVVSNRDWLNAFGPKLIENTRSIATTSALHMHRTLFPRNLIGGNARMKVCSIMGSL
jgi:hypothetical protein